MLGHNGGLSAITAADLWERVRTGDFLRLTGCGLGRWRGGSLGLVDDPALIDLATLISRGMPFDRETPLGDDPSLWPTNVCALARVGIPGLVYRALSLPRDPAIVDSEMCRKRIFRILEKFPMEDSGR
jgi:hypothetical protein